MSDTRDKIADAADGEIRRASTTAHVRAIRGVRKARRAGGGSREVNRALDRAMKFLAEAVVVALAAAIVAAYVEGALQRRRRLRSRLRGFGFNLLQDAVSQARRRARLTPEEVADIQERAGSTAAATVGAYADEVNARLRAVVHRGIRDNLHEQDLATKIGKALRAAGVSERPYRLRQMARDQVNLNFMAARLQGNDSPEVREVLWGYEYVTVGDDRVRPNHELLNGTRLPKDHAFWQENMPPNGYNCRCTVIEIFRDEKPRARKPHPPVKFGGKTYRAEADEGWKFNPAQAVLGPRAKLDRAVRKGRCSS